MLLQVPITHYCLLSCITLYGHTAMDKYSPAGKFGLFPVFAITNKADVNICAQVFMRTVFSFSWVKYLGMEWLD